MEPHRTKGSEIEECMATLQKNTHVLQAQGSRMGGMAVLIVVRGCMVGCASPGPHA